MDRTRAWAWTAIVSSIVALIISPFLAAAYLATEDGSDEPPLLPWMDTFREATGPALTFGDADAVYMAYGRGSWTMGLAIVAGAVLLHGPQAARGGAFERWSFRALVAGGALGAVGTFVVYFVTLSDVVFFALLVPAMLLTILGSLLFGIATVRAKVAPRWIAWLVLLGGPLQPFLSSALGHNLIAFAPLLVAMLGAGVWTLRAR